MTKTKHLLIFVCINPGDVLHSYFSIHRIFGTMSKEDGINNIDGLLAVEFQVCTHVGEGIHHSLSKLVICRHHRL